MSHENSPEIDLMDLTFDFEDYFDRYGTNRMSEDEKRDFSARVYGMFCRDFYNSGGNPAAIPQWVAGYIADKLYQVLGGVPWQDIMHLPWDEPTPWLTTKGERALEIYTGVEDALSVTPEANTTDLIYEQAKKHNVSYETARADYYTMKSSIKSKNGMPKKFLINRDES